MERVIQESYNPGLLDFAIGQVNSVLNLPDKLVKFFGGIQIVEELQSILLVKNFWGACYNDSQVSPYTKANYL